ncbi:MAG: response regulator transcription factor [Christiangramia sp.]
MKILLVEDESGIANFVQQGLEENGYPVKVAEDGIKGLELALTGEYELLLLDWMLPGISGIEICSEFRKKYSHIPIIFLTAKDTVEETIIGLQSGANDYIKKPFHFKELLERIRVQLRRNTNEETEVLSVGNIVLNIDTHQVLKNEKEVHLTQREFDLLQFLLKKKGKVCERTEIIQKVWDIHFEYDTSVIDVYINSLRKKLNLNATENYIETIRGVGYIIKDFQSES